MITFNLRYIDNDGYPYYKNALIKASTELEAHDKLKKIILDIKCIITDSISED